MKINLHTHSSVSDGALSVENLAEILKNNSYDLVALTDHDSVDGTLNFNELCAKKGLACVAGVEITSYLDPQIGLYDDTYKVHILGLNIDVKAVSKALEEVMHRRISYHKNLLDTMLNNYDEKILENRIACATELVKKGKFRTVKEAVKLLKVSSYSLSIKETINLIHSAKGIAIWAHPFILPRNGDFKISFSEVEIIYRFMINAGIDGLEAFYLQFSRSEQDSLKSLSEKYGGLCSTGTDFHGDYKFEKNLLERIGEVDINLLKRLQLQ